MAWKYSTIDSTRVATKTDMELRDIAGMLCNNLAPLVGCRFKSKKWSPATARKTCEPLNLTTGGEVTNLAKLVYDADDLFSYTFVPNIGSKGYEIYNKVMDYSNDVLDEYYMFSSDNYFTLGMTVKTKLKIVSTTSILYDSTIFTSVYNNPQLMLTTQYKQIFMVLLAVFSLRYYLFEYAFEDSQELSELVNPIFINNLCGSIKYIKMKLLELTIHEIVETESSVHFICDQLNDLERNVHLIEAEFLKYIK
jgi:hypothetical protein